MNFFGSVIVLLLTWFYYIYRKFKRSQEFFDRNDIPYLKPTILVGNIGEAFTKKKPLTILHLEQYRKLEPHKVAGYFNFHKPTVLIRDPELIKHVMVKDFEHFHDRNLTTNIEEDPLSNHLMTLKGEKWKNLRVKLTSTFTSGKMKMMFPLAKACGDKLDRVLGTMTEEPFDVNEICARFMTDVIGSCVLGIATHSLDDPDTEFRRIGKLILQFRYEGVIMRAYPNLPKSLIKLFKLRRVPKEVEDFFMSVVESTIKHREENNVVRNDFIDLLIALKNKSMSKYKDYEEQEEIDKFLSQVGSKKSKDDVEMTFDLMAAQCYVFFGAGFESSSTMLSFLLLELATHQDIQNKLRDEINTVINNNPEGFTYDLMMMMPYADMVIAECLRKYPSVSIASRQCTIDYKLPNTNIIIPKNMMVAIPTFGLHRDPKYYEKPDDFYPEHFTKEAVAKRPHYTYSPFGEGPRICIGERFARMQLKIGLISMLRNFKYEISPKTILPVQFAPHTFLIKPKTNIWLQCKRI